MSFRYIGGFLSPTYNPLQVPDAPTIGEATAGESSASVAFTAPDNPGGSAITEYKAISTPGNITGTASSSPVTVAGLSNGTSYTFQVWAINPYGPGPLSDPSNSVTPAAGAVGVVAGGLGAGITNVIQYFSIASLGNSLDFGDLSTADYSACSCSSLTRGIIAGGSSTSAIQYITVATTGNTTNFGNISSGINQSRTGFNSDTRGVFAGGKNSSFLSVSNIDYITIATTGNTTNFGNITVARNDTAAVSSSTRGVIGGGQADGVGVNVMDYVTIATTGNATDFGDLLTAKYNMAGASNSTRGLFAGGNVQQNVVQYITIASTGNATDFGDLTIDVSSFSGASSTTRAVFSGGEFSGSATNVMSYVTIGTTGNAVDFGDLYLAVRFNTGFSNQNGGVQ